MCENARVKQCFQAKRIGQTCSESKRILGFTGQAEENGTKTRSKHVLKRLRKQDKKKEKNF